METISIQVNAEVAEAFQKAHPAQKQKIQALMNSWLERAVHSTKLQETMDRMGDEAKLNGLTPEILQSILDE